MPLLLESEDEADQQLEDSVLNVNSVAFVVLYVKIAVNMIVLFSDENEEYGAAQPISERAR